MAFDLNICFTLGATLTELLPLEIHLRGLSFHLFRSFSLVMNNPRRIH